MAELPPFHHPFTGEISGARQGEPLLMRYVRRDVAEEIVLQTIAPKTNRHQGLSPAGVIAGFHRRM